MAIELIRSGPRIATRTSCQHNWTLQVSAVSTEEGLSNKIFVYHATPEGDPLQGDTFSNVASLHDMNIIPEDAPMAIPAEDSKENFIPFYRTDTVTFDCYNQQEAERIWKIIQIDAKSLLEEYRISRNLKESGRVEIDDATVLA